MTTTDSEAVRTVLTAFATSWASLDGDAVADCLAPSATVIGTDPGEYIVGADAYRAGWQNGVYPLTIAEFGWVDEPRITVEGRTAWAHGLIEYDMVVRAGDRVRGRMWISTVLCRSEAWRIAHLHASHADVPIVGRP